MKGSVESSLIISTEGSPTFFYESVSEVNVF